MGGDPNFWFKQLTTAVVMTLRDFRENSFFAVTKKKGRKKKKGKSKKTSATMFN